MTAGLDLSLELIGILGGALLVVLSVYGTLLKYLYDRDKQRDHTLNGTNGNDGFISEQRKTNTEILRSQVEIERSMQAHGALLQEMVYVIHDIADTLDDEDVANVDIRRIEYLERMLREHDAFPDARRADGGQRESADKDMDDFSDFDDFDKPVDRDGFYD